MSTLEVEKMRANAKLREEKARLVHLRQQEHSQGLKKSTGSVGAFDRGRDRCRN